MATSFNLVSEIVALHARGIDAEQLARWLERRGYAQVYSASLLVQALHIDVHSAVVAVCASGTWTGRRVEPERVEQRLALVCNRNVAAHASENAAVVRQG